MEYREINKSISAGRIGYEESSRDKISSPTCECTCACACFCNCFDTSFRDLDLVESDLELTTA